MADETCHKYMHTLWYISINNNNNKIYKGYTTFNVEILRRQGPEFEPEALSTQVLVKYLGQKILVTLTNYPLWTLSGNSRVQSSVDDNALKRNGDTRNSSEAQFRSNVLVIATSCRISCWHRRDLLAHTLNLRHWQSSFEWKSLLTKTVLFHARKTQEHVHCIYSSSSTP